MPDETRDLLSIERAGVPLFDDPGGSAVRILVGSVVQPDEFDLRPSVTAKDAGIEAGCPAARDRVVQDDWED